LFASAFSRAILPTYVRPDFLGRLVSPQRSPGSQCPYRHPEKLSGLIVSSIDFRHSCVVSGVPCQTLY
jgi:hypothetical protein